MNVATPLQRVHHARQINTSIIRHVTMYAPMDIMVSINSATRVKIHVKPATFRQAIVLNVL